jgi:hypothetical protein
MSRKKGPPVFALFSRWLKRLRKKLIFGKSRFAVKLQKHMTYNDVIAILWKMKNDAHDLEKLPTNVAILKFEVPLLSTFKF